MIGSFFLSVSTFSFLISTSKVCMSQCGTISPFSFSVVMIQSRYAFFGSCPVLDSMSIA